MFETATFESMGTIHTHSRNWMIATFGLNASILAVFVAIPLMYPSALTQMMNSISIVAPPQPEEPKPVPQHVQPAASARQTEIIDGRVQAPPSIPKGVWTSTTVEAPQPVDASVLAAPAIPGAGCDPFGCGHAKPDVHVVQGKPQTVSTGVMNGLLLNKVVPAYPAPARALHLAGTVELQATISRTGTIENLRVVSGPALLQQAAVDAVRQWRYKPYLLNGEPVEVETTINVEFRLN